MITFDLATNYFGLTTYFCGPASLRVSAFSVMNQQDAPVITVGYIFY